MPQVMLLAAIGAGIYAGYRALVRAGEKLAADLKRGDDEHRAHAAAAEKSVMEKDLGSLEYDPRSGVYKPRLR